MPRVNVVSTGSYYGRESFKPAEIVQHVAAIQAAFYLSDLLLITVLDYVLGVSVHSARGQFSTLRRQVLDHTVPALDTSAGLIAVAAFYISIIVVSSAAFTYLVGRSKRALDFAFTLLAVHFVVCALAYGLPASGLWWFMTGSAGVVMVLVSEALSRRLELREIAVAQDEENPEA